MVLGVYPRSSKEEIHNAVEDALLDAEGVEDERVLDIARQALVAPTERLRAELSYLLELRPSEARKALAGGDSTHWFAIAESTFGIAKTNALVQALKAGVEASALQATILAIFESWDEISEAEILDRINEDRKVAAFSEASRADVRKGLNELRSIHAEEAIDSLDENGNVSHQLAQLLADKIIPTGRLGDKFSTALITAYAKKTGGALTKSADRTLVSLDHYVASGTEADFSRFAADCSPSAPMAQI